MTRSISIVAVARQIGISARTLRYYESRGLLTPSRSAAGRRLYDTGDLARIHQILVLKRAGLSLAQIGVLFERQPIDLEQLLGDQLERLRDRRHELDGMQATLSAALAHLASGEALSLDQLCDLIRESEACGEASGDWKAILDRYWSTHAQDEWCAVMAPIWAAHPKWTDGGYERLWQDLSARIEAALPLDPLDERALAFSREWNALIEPITRAATLSMRASTAAMFEDRARWDNDAEAGFSHAVWCWMRDAQAAQRAAGCDIGLSPFTMQPTDTGAGKGDEK